MNIFLDTSVLYTDPFTTNREIAILINLAKVKKINLFISEIVCFELAKNTNQNQKRIKKEINRMLSDINKISLNKIQVPIINISDTMLDDIKNNFLSNNIQIIECDYNIITKITLKKYLENTKPFDFGKDSFKDSLIWLSYVEYIKQNKLKDNYFISENIKDFADKKTMKLHNDLINDCDKVTYYKNLAALLNCFEFKNLMDKIELDIKSKELKKWYLDTITDEYLKDLFYSKYSGEVNYKIFTYCSELDSSEYSDYSMNGYIDNDVGFDINDFKILNVDFLSKVYILGECELSFNASIMEKNIDPDPDEDDFILLDSIDLEEKCYFSFVIDENHTFSSFEINFSDEYDNERNS
jgi:hypothetical protein